jgi:hypothetical protein
MYLTTPKVLNKYFSPLTEKYYQKNQIPFITFGIFFIYNIPESFLSRSKISLNLINNFKHFNTLIMKNFKIAFLFLFLSTLNSCGGRNEVEEKNEKEINSQPTSNVPHQTADTENLNQETSLNSATENNNPSNSSISTAKNNSNNNPAEKDQIIPSPEKKEADVIINSPLRNLLNNGHLGKTYTKKELIEQYKFPKEAVALIKQVTFVGPNKLYFKWGSTWLVEKVSDAEFENDTMAFTFKQNKTYVSGGAIGIKYNKKIYTELILNNGAAYIPTVKGYHWDINK